jgi:hypothetical protein
MNASIFQQMITDSKFQEEAEKYLCDLPKVTLCILL